LDDSAESPIERSKVLTDTFVILANADRQSKPSARGDGWHKPSFFFIIIETRLGPCLLGSARSIKRRLTFTRHGLMRALPFVAASRPFGISLPIFSFVGHPGPWAGMVFGISTPICGRAAHATSNRCRSISLTGRETAMCRNKSFEILLQLWPQWTIVIMATVDSP
jgi:hypothetical protein